MSCFHTDLTFELAPPEAYEDTNVRRVLLRVHCKKCKEPLRFIGIDAGASLTRPCTSADGFTVIIPGVMGIDDVVHERRMAS